MAIGNSAARITLLVVRRQAHFHIPAPLHHHHHADREEENHGAMIIIITSEDREEETFGVEMIAD